MKRKKALCFRIIVKIFLSLFIALALEAVFNLPAFNEGYGYRQLSYSSKKENEKLTVSAQFEQPIYIKKLLLEGEFHKNPYYTIEITAVNGFGTKELVKLEDRANSLADQAFTNIGYKVLDMKIIFDNSTQVELRNILISNQIQLSQYRIFFFAFIFLMFILIFTEKTLILEHIELLYAAGTLGFGILLIVASGPQAITWDEEVHYRDAYLSSFSGNVYITSAAQQNFERSAFSVNTGEERILLERYINNLSENETILDNTTIGIRQQLTYLPQSVFLCIGRWLNLPYSVQFALGRFGNLLFCMILSIIAIRISQRKKILIATIALLPTIIFQSCMYTYDGSIYASVLLGTVLCLKSIEDNKKQTNIKILLFATILFLWGNLIKLVYLPFMLFLYFPLRNIINLCSYKQKRYLKTVGLVAMLLAVILGISVVVYVIKGNINIASDLRGGETSVSDQLLSIIKHPIYFIKVLISQMFTMDNFRNFGDPALNRFFVSNLMFLNLYVLGMLKDAWSLILLPLLVMIFVIEPEECKAINGVRSIRRISGGVVFLCTILIWVSMYLLFTPVGSSVINGVQARYFLPLIMPTASLLFNQRFKIKITTLKYNQIITGLTLFLTAVCMYQCVIKGRIL